MREEKIKLYIVIYLKLVARPVCTFPSVKLLKSKLGLMQKSGAHCSVTSKKNFFAIPN